MWVKEDRGKYNYITLFQFHFLTTEHEITAFVVIIEHTNETNDWNATLLTIK